MEEAMESSYDAIPYQGRAFRETHPDHLATVAALHGLQSPSPVHCRVLEIGCGDGQNLVPMAESLPQSAFLGIDLGETHIEHARQFASDIEVTNVEFRRQDIVEFGEDEGLFDYIICHGVYSWVPPDIQRRILKICSKQLAPNGVAFVSYNTLPGWHLKRMVRDITAYANGGETDPQKRLERARKVVTQMADGLATFQDAYGALLRGEFEQARAAEDHYFYHEFLEAHNEPLYLHQFVGRAKASGLQYLGDCEIRMSLPGGAPHIEAFLDVLSSDRIERHQYADFIFNAPFRMTLLCQAEIEVNPKVDPGVVLDFCASTQANVSEEAPNAEAWIRAGDGTELALRLPLIRHAFRHLASVQPRRLGVDELLGAARVSMGLPEASPTRESDQEVLCQWLLRGQATVPASVINLHRYPNRFATEVSERPLASPVVRWQSARSAPAVTSRGHEHKPLDELHRRVLILLDGSRGYEDLMPHVHSWRDSGILPESCQCLKDGEVVAEVLRNCLNAGLLIG